MTGIGVQAGSWLLRSETHHIPFRDPFRIGRAHDAHVATTLIVELEDGSGQMGLGEGFPDAYYGETEATMEAVLPLLLEALARLGPMPLELPEVRAWLARSAAAMDEAIGHHGAAKCAVDIALHDLAGQRLGLALPELLGTPREIPPTDFTIGIDEPEAVAARAARAAGFPALKIKVGGSHDLATLEAVRGVYSGPIRVDANTAWDLEGGTRLVPELLRLGVELIEQPFPAHRLADLGRLQAATSLPIVADESAVVETDLEGLVGVVAGVNVKLAKVGGVGPALRMIRRARELGFRVFLGCMEETSVGICASAAVAGLVEWVDLDGSLLLATDPYAGLELGPDYRWQLPTEPGLGLRRRAPDA
ncbi:MAG: dipeptide epimerase [Candidatus Limnocylindrales bacterium]